MAATAAATLASATASVSAVPTVINSVIPREFLYPALLWLAVPAALLLLWLARRSFVADNPRFDDADSIRRRSRLRWIVFALRTLAVLCLILVLATPLTRQTTIRPGDVHLTVLIDNSSSMQALDTGAVDGLVTELRKTLPVTVHTITPGDSSPLGDAVLANLKPGENLLLVTDGHVTAGQSLASAFGYAAQGNSTVSALALDPRIDDAAITVQAPQKAIADTNTTIVASISSTHTDAIQVQIAIDNVTVFNQKTAERSITITKSFPAGKHRITAIINESDAISINNRYDAILSVVEKPPILVVAQKDSALIELLRQLYTVNVSTTLPTVQSALDPYYAVVLIDLPASGISPSTGALTQYALAGNGIFVVGGPTSYDYGNYKNAPFEVLLPVSVGASKGSQGITNIAVSLDMSSALEGSYALQPDGTLKYTKSDHPGLVRSLANSVLDDIDPNHNVGAVVVGAASANASENLLGGQLISWDYIGGTALGHVSTLGPKRDQLKAAISVIRGGGQAASQYWLAAPLKALAGVSGSKNIIVFTDGLSCRTNCLASAGGSDEQQTINIASTIAAQGGRVYVVGVVPGLNDEFLTAVAQAGNGIYFQASDKNKLHILFGNPNDKDTGGDAFSVVILNANHFITRDVSVSSTLFGFNQVVPKQYASLLATLQNGQPVLTVWNYGVGRVASLTAYNGEGYGDLTAKGNSLLLSRTGNWLIGDPERKQNTVVTVPQLRIGEQGIIRVTSTSIPTNSVLSFVPRGDDVYEATFTASTAGFGSVGGIPYAVSYPAEYEQVGMDPNFAQTLAISNGQLFKPTDVNGIIDHVRTVRQLQETRKQPLRSPFLLAAAIIFLIEIAIRRLFEITRARNA